MNPSPVRFGIALVVIIMLLAVVSSAFGAAVALTPEEAIERAIVRRMGGSVSVLVEVLRADVGREPALRAILDPAARAGRPARFVLTAGGVRKGLAVATVQIEAEHARATRAIARGEVVEAGAIEIVTGELPGIALRRLPAPGEVLGLEAVRTIAPGEPLTDAVVRVPPVVRSGDEVAITVMLDGVSVTGIGVASGSGHEGDVIGVLSPNRRRPLKARITGHGAVEVLR